MLKIFLVEDEFIVREGIKRNIKWGDFGYAFVGEASDGELAYPMILKEEPDIVITDIKMPFMDGLTLSKLIKQELPQTEIILLTGHEEFEYAKEAVKIGVAEYLTKPISPGKLLEVVGEVGQKILDRRAEDEYKAMYLKDMEENLKEDRRDFLQYLVTGSKSTIEILELAKKLEIDITAVWYNILLLGVKSNDHAIDEFSDQIIRYGEHVRSIAEKHNAVFFDRKLEGYCILFKGDSEEELEARQTAFIREFEKLFEDQEDLIYFGGLSNPVNRLRDLSECFITASKAFANRYFMSPKQIVTVSMQEEMEMSVKEETLSVSDINLSEFRKTKIREYLRSGDVEEFDYFITDLFLHIGEKALESRLFRQYVTMDIYFNVCEFMEELGSSKELVENFEVMEILNDKEQMKAYLKRIMMEALKFRDHMTLDRHSDVVELVKQYVKEHYQKDELSLNELASIVNFSPNHLSMLFSQKTGDTLIKYITQVRMEKARELLKCTNKKSSQIAFEVGYKDPHYFSYLFKKTHGVTPTQFRNSIVE